MRLLRTRAREHTEGEGRRRSEEVSSQTVLLRPGPGLKQTGPDSGEGGKHWSISIPTAQYPLQGEGKLLCLLCMSVQPESRSLRVLSLRAGKDWKLLAERHPLCPKLMPSPHSSKPETDFALRQDLCPCHESLTVLDILLSLDIH